MKFFEAGRFVFVLVFFASFLVCFIFFKSIRFGYRKQILNFVGDENDLHHEYGVVN